MKKLLTFMIVWTCLLTLAGCGKKDMDYTMQNESSVAESVRETGEESVLIQNEDAGEGENSAPETKYITIDLSGVGEIHPKGDAVSPLTLKIVSEEENGIDFANEWYESKQLSLPMVGKEWNNFYDDEYQYIWSGDALYIYENISGNCLYVLEYPTDKWYINGNNACLLDDIFYGISVTNGYAQPDSCFMFAYDLENNKLLWRSGDQTCNTMNFIVKKDVIICGYGFTSEKDYLYQLNLHTGEVIASLELKKQPDLLVPQDNMLYVHTYSYNYTIEMQ
ncbi:MULTISPECIES: hypothetical protein [Clostridium]|jgi:hypothetical protein|uniref:hypothetical protein n=1 Tax=Clostridium TaxID=1485 RepID=UPI000E530112|nr:MULTISPECIES: hypothetical protein [Clostridium]RHP15722.1 hypothetical protein DWZ76_06755 [Clostridium sp. AF35-15]RHQ87851.1 hypothetical protein DWX91_01125 [Clostridium sp. AF22-10]RHV35825.1 hypothetical protein DXB56_01110 [Clostridium sp. OM04-7]